MATEADNQKLVETFQEITSCTKEEALFYLESHNWNLDYAVSTFLENNNPIDPIAVDDDDTDDPDYINPPNPLASSVPPSPTPSPLVPSSDSRSTRAMASRDKKPSKPSGSRSGGIRTLADLNRRPDPGSDDDSDEPQEYYAGGEKSGMLVQGPPKGTDVDSIFDQARQQGAIEAPAENLPPSSSRSFTGAGRTLSGEPAPPSAPQQPVPVFHNIIFWSNGFTINDGPLRRLDDPENAPFLESIKKSECPKELEPADRRSQVHVSLSRRDENCPEPEKHHVPFQGVGRTLGSSAPTSTPAPTATPTAAVTAAAAGHTVLPPSVNAAPAPSVGLVVDANLPSTSIQLRLADGTRMVSRFNYHHTVGDIRGFIDASRPGGPRTYQLQTVGFPPKQLTDVSQTIEQAGLANSVVIQKQ